MSTRFDKKPKTILSFVLHGLFPALIFVLAGMLCFIIMEKVDPRFEVPQNFFKFAFPIGVIIFEIILVLVFLKETKHRKSDPYRFSRKQYRILTLQTLPSIKHVLESMNYKVLKEESSDADQYIEAFRNHPKNLEGFVEKKFPIEVKIAIQITKAPGHYEIEIEGTPYSKIAAGDYKSTVYDSLEELVKILNS